MSEMLMIKGSNDDLKIHVEGDHAEIVTNLAQAYSDCEDVRTIIDDLYDLLENLEAMDDLRSVNMN